MKFGYPLLLDVSDRLCVIVGGGRVAVRKANGLLAAGAKRVRVVAPVIDQDMPSAVEQIRAEYNPSHVVGASLVFAATSDPEINQCITRDAGANAALVNRADADDESTSDFSTPALIRQGETLICVSAGGNPALAVRIRDELAGQLDRRVVEMASAMQIVRPMVLESNLGIDKRREIFRDLAGEEYLQLLSEKGIAALRDAINDRIDRETGKKGTA